MEVISDEQDHTSTSSNIFHSEKFPLKIIEKTINILPPFLFPLLPTEGGGAGDSGVSIPHTRFFIICPYQIIPKFSL
jgi:hypothetical protein